MLVSNLEIAQQAQLRPIVDVASDLGLAAEEIELYGAHKAKVRLEALQQRADRADGQLVVVTGITPTRTGEGKTTVAIGLAQALWRMGKTTSVCLREPSLGPTLGMKGGACGAGLSQVVPMEDINLHFTGDIHAVTSAHNLLAAMIDNHLHFGNALDLDVRSISWPRVIDLCDRALRHTLVGLGGRTGGVPRETGFVITAASEVMAILCLASGPADLKERLGSIIVGYTGSGDPVRARDLNAHGAMAALLKDALKPNLVQTLEGSPAFIHGGPFGNIAHGTSSLLATRLALKLSDLVVIEAGFGSDLGAEKFFDIKCRQSGIVPSGCIIAATLKAIKRSGGAGEADLRILDGSAVAAGIENVYAHIDNIRQFGVPVAVALNRFEADSEHELEMARQAISAYGCPVAVVDVCSGGGEGGLPLAEVLLDLLDHATAQFRFLYPDEMPLTEKVETIARRVYGADGVVWLPAAQKKLSSFEALGMGHLPICVAKTQYSLTDDPNRIGRPRGFQITVRDASASAGAGVVICYTGEIMTMPGLSARPAAVNVDLTDDGEIAGLF